MRARRPREPRQAEIRYLAASDSVWRRAKALIEIGLDPLLAVWPEPPVQDARAVYLWPGIEASLVERYAPWATSPERVAAVAFPGQRPPLVAIQAFVSRSIAQGQALDRGQIKPRRRGALPLLIDEAGSAVPTPPTFAAASPEAALQTLSWCRHALGAAVSAKTLLPVVVAQGRRVERLVDSEVRRLITDKAATDTPAWANLIQPWTRDNVDLISSAVHDPNHFGRPSMLDDIAETIAAAFQEGLRVDSLMLVLQERFDVGKSRLRLIARDQTLKLNGRLHQHKQTSLGVTEYIWRTARDSKVRDTHRALEGTKQEWAHPPGPGHPGEDIQCRCVAEPVLPDF